MTSPSRPSSTLTAYSSAPPRIRSASSWASAMIRRLSASAAWVRPRSSIRNAACSWARRDDPLRLLLRLLDDPLALGVDALGGADLLGDGDPQLVDEPERGVLVDHDVGGQRQLLAVGDQRLEALDEEDDVDGGALLPGLCRTRSVARRVRPIMARAGPGDGPTGCRPVSGSRGPPRAPPPRPGSIAETSPPKLAISLTRLELT